MLLPDSPKLTPKHQPPFYNTVCYEIKYLISGQPLTFLTTSKLLIKKVMDATKSTKESKKQRVKTKERVPRYLPFFSKETIKITLFFPQKQT